MAAPGSPEWHDQVARERQLRDAQFRAQQDAFNRAQRARNEAARVAREAANREAANKRSGEVLSGMLGLPGSGSAHRMGQNLAGRDFDGKFFHEKNQQHRHTTPINYSKALTEEDKKNISSARIYKQIRRISSNPRLKDCVSQLDPKSKNRLVSFFLTSNKIGLYKNAGANDGIADLLKTAPSRKDFHRKLLTLTTRELDELELVLRPLLKISNGPYREELKVKPKNMPEAARAVVRVSLKTVILVVSLFLGLGSAVALILALKVAMHGL